ncbi:hypothetical protein C3L33_03257, partial [Rhododendron williamsianum]
MSAVCPSGLELVQFQIKEQVPSTLIPNCRKLPARVACLGDFSYCRIAFAAAWGALIKMFSPYGKIVAEDFLWHTRGRKRGEPRGFAFVQFSTKEEAELAKEKMNGKLAGGRPLVVRLASEKNLVETTETSSKPIGVARLRVLLSVVQDKRAEVLK